MLFRRISTMIMGALFVMSVFATQFHKTTETHVVCLEHSHVVHGDHGMDDIEVANTAVLYDVESDHDECGLDFSTQESATAPSHVLYSVRLTPQQDLLKGKPYAFSWSSNALQDAPKTSPPLQRI